MSFSTTSVHPAAAAATLFLMPKALFLLCFLPFTFFSSFFLSKDRNACSHHNSTTYDDDQGTTKIESQRLSYFLKSGSSASFLHNKRDTFFGKRHLSPLSYIGLNVFFRCYRAAAPSVESAAAAADDAIITNLSLFSSKLIWRK